MSRRTLSEMQWARIERLVPGKKGHHPREDAFLAPTLPMDMTRLVKAIGGRRIIPAQTIAADQDNPAQNSPVVAPELTVRLWKVEFQTCHLRAGQSEKNAHFPALFPEP